MQWWPYGTVRVELRAANSSEKKTKKQRLLEGFCARMRSKAKAQQEKEAKEAQQQAFLLQQEEERRQQVRAVRGVLLSSSSLNGCVLGSGRGIAGTIKRSQGERF